MPVDYYIDIEAGIVYTKAWGHLLEQEVQDFLERFLQDADLEPTFSQLADFRYVTSVSVSPKTIRKSARLSRFGPEARRVAVVQSAAAYGLARMYIMLRGDSGQMQIFREMAEALAWLEIASGFPDTLFSD